MAGVQLAAVVGNVITLVAIAGEGEGFTAGLQVAQPYAGAEDVHLAAGIVHVVFALHVVACSSEHVGNTGAIGGAATVANMQWPGGVGGHKFYLDALVFRVAATELLALGKDVFDHAEVGGFIHKEVDKAGAGDFHFYHVVAGGQGVDNLLGNGAGVTAQWFGQHHCDVAGEVAMGLVFAALELN